MPDVALRGQAMPDAALADAPPFYMKSAQVLDSKIQGRAATAEQVRAILKNPQNGIKAEELKWTGIEQAVERIAKENGGKVPKEALLLYLQEDGAVRLEEVTMGGARKQWTQADIEALERQAQRTRDFSEYERAILEYEDQQLGSNANDTGNQTRFGQYQLPGGENYREVVLAMPPETTVRNFKAGLDPSPDTAPQSGKYAIMDADGRVIERGYANVYAAQVAAERMRNTQNYYSNHFPDTPNYVAHARLNERTDAAGKPGLFLEEIQSDRHQAGRERGYIGDQSAFTDMPEGYRIRSRREVEAPGDSGNVTRYWVETPEGNRVTAEQYSREGAVSEIVNTLNDQARGTTQSPIPDAPFRKDWPVQMFKRALADAVGSGKEWIGWTTGETQADRYDLSKQMQRIVAKKNSKGEFSIGGVDVNGQSTEFGTYPADKLEGVVGKDLAAKIVKQESPNEVYAGNDLKVGGEGMKGFYDQILPKEISKYVKQWGGQVEKDNLRVIEANQRNIDQDHPPTVKEPIWRVNITPQMREGIKKAGQALFVGGAAAVVAEDQLEQ
jgi:hypothetical protein